MIQRASGQTATQIAEQATARGAHPHVLDGQKVRTRQQFYAAIATALDFPEYFGKNLDALHDLLTDLDWLPGGDHVLIWSGHKALRGAEPDSYAALCEVLSDAADYTEHGRSFSVVLTEK
ncbi:barnase inhibitor [Pseudonocardiaceae bacterium YIM PH 21723]|nr:barnase inhibitor [Pseudonocardiaceae bacterium YIM PH 21723]